jgi:hypothetical protein
MGKSESSSTFFNMVGTVMAGATSHFSKTIEWPKEIPGRAPR